MQNRKVLTQTTIGTASGSFRPARQTRSIGQRDEHASAGATEPRRKPDELENARRSRYFFLAAFFLAAGFFLAAFFLAAMMFYLLHLISDPMNSCGSGGSSIHSRENVCRLESGRLCDGN